MMYLKKNTNNIYVAELTSRSSLMSPFYLFEMISDDRSGYSKLFNVTDESTFKSRYNKFSIVESGSTYENLSGSTVNLIPGSYTLNVYESNVQTLQISGTTGEIIYTNKAYVNGTNNDVDEVYR